MTDYRMVGLFSRTALTGRAPTAQYRTFASLARTARHTEPESVRGVF